MSRTAAECAEIGAVGGAFGTSDREGVSAAVVKKNVEPNQLFWKARTARGLSRPEVADAANGEPVMQGCGHAPMDENYVGRIEQGRIGGGMCPERLSALCVVLKVEDPAELGLVAGRRLPTRSAPTRRREGTIGNGGASSVLKPDPPQPEPSGASVAGEQGPSLLRTILADRHWQVFRTFRAHFVRAARELADHEGDPTVGMLDVSERQFHRWLQGVRPRPDACRVLESMFDHPIARLIGPAEATPALGADSAGASHAAPAGPVSVPGSAARLSEVVTGSETVQVSVSADAGAAVTVVCQDGAPGRVAVVAGTVRVLIAVSGTEAAGLVAGGLDAPMAAGGARVYSLAERRAR